ncbi:hypothetical protein GJAV_G00107700 [Gymnothorax javanicus]|nr:hypothetical protein GJAV_G00107700 [Gymnothorax javanicus]
MYAPELWPEGDLVRRYYESCKATASGPTKPTMPPAVEVEIDVPQACSYILRTTECTLSEVSDVSAEGLPVYAPAAGADAFQAAMAKHPLKLTVEGESKVSLFPEEDEPTNILNIKRGIVSALLVPALEEESNKNMATLHGMCKTNYAVNTVEDIATDVTVVRDLSHCDSFTPKKDAASPLALISGLHMPLSKLISSTQTCNYKFDNEKKHMTEGPALRSTSCCLSLTNEANLKTLPMEAVEDKSPVQTKDAALATLTKLSALSQGKSRVHLFQKLVTEIRGLRSEALSAALPEMMEVSGLLTWQALAQCGTPECSSAVLQILRTKDQSALEVDAAVYAMGLLPNPDKHLVKEMLSMAEYKQSKPILYGLSNIVRRVYKIEGKVTPEITAVSEYMASLLGDCSGDKDQTFLALRVIGNMGEAMEAANPALKTALLQCMTQPEATPIVQQAAIQAFRKLTIDEEARSALLQTVLDGASPIQKRVAAYLVLMKNPEASDLAQVISALPDEQDPQAKSFVASHLANVLSSTDPASRPMREKITEALQGNEVPAALEFSKFSRNYKMSNALGGNVIFDSTGYLPKEVMLETTLKAFGYDLDVMEVPENILREISQNVNKLVMELKSHESPDALVYLKLLGAELGFISTNEMETMAYSAVKIADHLLKKFPMEIKKLISSSDNELFIHYILMDNEFSLPTASGVPLKVSLSGTIASGIKGGFHITPELREMSFMPSVGVEFTTEVGVHVPELVTAAVAMHTNIYHESGLHAKVAMGDGQIKLTIPAPEGPTRLLEISVVIELVPTGQVTEYTAAISYQLLAEGEEPEKVDALKIALAAEGAEPMEATAVVKLNRNTHVLTTDVHIPDLDISGGLRLGVSDDSTNGKAIMIDITHNNIPQVSLIGRAKLEAMKDGMLQVQLSVPSLKTDATASVALKRAEDLTLELESVINIPETSSVQKVIVRYGADMIEVELKSDLSSEVHKLLHHVDEYQKIVQDILEMTVTKTEMTVRDIISQSIETTNILLDRALADAPAPYLEKLRELTELYLPEKLFVKSEGTIKYHFNSNHITFSVPLPLGGQSSEALSIPKTLTLTPHLNVPITGLDIPPMELTIPTFSIPSKYDLSLPLFGLAEVSLKVDSNVYSWEGSVSIDAPGRIATYKSVGECPVEILSYTIEGSGALITTPEESLKATLKSALSNKLIDVSVSFEGEGSINDKISIKTTNKLEASSPLGLHAALDYTAQAVLSQEEFAVDGNLDGIVNVGSVNAKASGSQSYKVNPFSREVNGESTFKIESPLLQTQGSIKGALTGSSGLEVHTEGSLLLGVTHGSHKAFLTIGNGNLATSGTTTLQRGPLALENVFNGGVDARGITLSIISKGSMLEMKIENTNTLTINEATFALRSEIDGAVSESNTYKQDITIEIKSDLASVIVNNDLHVLDISLNNEGVLKIQPYKIDLTGSLKGAFRDEELRHTYEINYSDLSATMKCNTNGRMLGAHLIHNTDFEVTGLTSKLSSEARLNSPVLRVDNTLHALILPFSITLDGTSNIDGQMSLLGNHTGQLYLKNLLRAEPLSVTISHDCRASTSHHLDIEASVQTHFDNKIDSLLTPQEQRGTWRVKSKLNNHAYNQVIDIYNVPERTGVELSGTVLTDLLSDPVGEIEEFSISSALKYDKNSDSHTFVLPAIEHLPAILQQIKMSIAHALDSLTQHINRDEIRTRLENLPQAVSDFVRQLDLEGKAIVLKDKINALLQDYSVTQEDLVAYLEYIKNAVDDILTNVEAILKSIVESEIWSVDMTDIITRIGTELKEIDKEYHVSATILSIINTIEDILGGVDLEMLKDSSIAWLQDYEIKAKLQEKVSELKHALESFDLEAFLTDLKDFLASLNVREYIEKFVAQMPKEIISKTVDTVKSIIIGTLTEFDIPEKINMVYTKVKDIILTHELDKKLELLLEKVVELVKQFKIDDTIQAVVNSISGLPSLYDRAMALVDSALHLLQTSDFRQIIDLLNGYIDTIVKKLRSFDYNAFVEVVNPTLNDIIVSMNEQILAYEIPQKIEAVKEFISWILTSLVDLKGALPEIMLPEIRIPHITIPKLSLENFDITSLSIPEFNTTSVPSEIIVPAFGKLHAGIRVKTPHHSIRTLAELQNTTSNPLTPQITAYLSSQMTSTADILNFVLDASTRVGIPKFSRVVIAETIKFTHSAASLEHQGSLTIYGFSSQTSAKTTAKVTTSIYNAELVNNAFLAFENGFSGSLDTTYNHDLNMSDIGLTSQASMTQKAGSRLESDTLHLAVGTTGHGKLSYQDHTEDLNHQSDLELALSIHSAKLTFTGNTEGQSLKMKQNLNADGILFGSITIDGRAETDAPFIKSSLMLVSGKADMGDLKIELKASHDTELEGSLSGTISNAVNLHANPSEIIIDVQNKGNAKAALPFSMSGKIELQNDYAVTLNAEVQQINWVALSRFNQYKYFHNLTLDNTEKKTEFSAAVNGEANLNILTFPLDIPEVTVPVINVKTPALHEVTLWENTGLKALLTTTEQNIDINLKLQYEKSPDVIFIGYDNIAIPALGNLIIDLSMKSPVFSVNADANLQNQEDITAHLAVSSTSLFDILKVKLDGTTSLSRKRRGVKIATAVSMEHQNIEGTHDSTINLQRRAIEASVATVAKVSLPILNLEINQKLVGSSKATPNVDSKTKLTCGFNIPLVDAIGNGEIEQTLVLEGLSGHISLDLSTKGKTEGTILASGTFAGALNNEANIYFDDNGLRSSLKTDANSNGKSGETNIWSIDMNEELDLEASLSRMHATLNLASNNEVNAVSLNTKGKHIVKATLECIPLATLTAHLDIDMSQSSSLGDAIILENIALEITTEKQKLSMTGKEQLSSVLHTSEWLLSNDATEIRLAIGESIDGHGAVLKAVKLPIYEKNLWDVLKFDEVTSEDDLQSVKGEIVVVCHKDHEGYIPTALSAIVKAISPVYSTTVTGSLEKHTPTYTASLKSTGTSTLAFLAYDLDAAATASLDGGFLSLNNKATFKHSDLDITVEHILPNAMRPKSDDSSDASPTRHTLNVDITSPIFSDMSLRFVSGLDSISATISAPTSGLLGLQLSDLSARLYGRYPSEPQNDVDILTVKVVQPLESAWNTEAITEILMGLKGRLPAITSSLHDAVNAYHRALFDMDIDSAFEELMHTLAAIPEGLHLQDASEFTTLVSNLLRQSQNAINMVLDKVIQFLREYQIPVLEGKPTLPELTQKVSSVVASTIEHALQKINEIIEPYIDAIITNLSNVKVTIPGTDEEGPLSPILENVKSARRNAQDKIVDMVRHLESPDVMVQKLADLVRDVVRKAEELTGSLESDVLDAVAAHVNNIFNWIKANVMKVYSNVSRESLTEYLQHLIETIRTPLEQIVSASTGAEAPAAEDVPAPVDVDTPEEVPAPEEEAVAQEETAAEEVPAAEDTPAAEEVPAAEDTPAAEEVPAAEE